MALLASLLLLMVVRMIMLMVDWITPELMRYIVMARTCSKKPISAK